MLASVAGPHWWPQPGISFSLFPPILRIGGISGARALQCASAGSGFPWYLFGVRKSQPAYISPGKSQPAYISLGKGQPMGDFSREKSTCVHFPRANLRGPGQKPVIWYNTRGATESGDSHAGGRDRYSRSKSSGTRLDTGSIVLMFTT